MARIEMHLFAGLGGRFFDRGTRALDAMADRLSPVWDANHWQQRQWQKASDGIIARQKAYGDKPVVILIGHSYGALRCQQIATRLRDRGIAVAYVAGIDATALAPGHPPMKIPDNVALIDEFWASSGFPAIARWRDPKGSKGGMYVVRPEMKDRHKVIKVPGGHIPCASDPITVTRIMEKVRGLVA
jgi:pimeloyl-ACP methyl ester carboxylesterase